MGKGEEEKKRKSDNEEISAEGSDFKVYFYCVEISLFRTVKSHLGEAPAYENEKKEQKKEQESGKLDAAADDA